MSRTRIMLNMTVIAAAFTLALLAAPLRGADAPVELSVEPQPLALGEPAQLNIITQSGSTPVIAEYPDTKEIEFLPGASRSSRTNIINGKRTVTSVTTYNFRPLKEGTLKIPSFTVNAGGKIVRTDPMELKVVKSRLVVRGEKGDGESLELDDLIFQKIALLSDKSEFYVGEEIQAEIRIFFMRGLKVEISWPQIETENVVFKDFGDVNPENNRFGKFRHMTEKIKGQPFEVYVLPTSFRAISPGRLKFKSIENCVLKIPQEKKRRSSIFDDDEFFDRFMGGGSFKQAPKALTAEITNVTIKDLPKEPANSKFVGLIGEWEIKMSLSSDRLKAGEPVTLSATMLGTGTLDTLKAPELDIPGFRVYPPEVDKKESKTGGSGRAEIKYVLIPTGEGKAEINVSLCSFSCEKGSYSEAVFRREATVEKSDSAAAQGKVFDSGAASSKGASAQPAEPAQKEKAMTEILYLKKEKGEGVPLPLWKNCRLWVILLIVLSPLAVVCEELLWRRRMSISRNPAARRKMDALARRAEVIGRLRKAGGGDFDEVVRKDVVPYLNDLLNLPPGTSENELAGHVDDEAIKESLRSVGESSYMPGAGRNRGESMREKLCDALKRYAPCLVALLLPLGLQASSEKELEWARLAYDRGEFAKSAGWFKKQIDKTEPSPNVLYNIGNCLCQQGDYGSALVYYERASRLAPRDSDVMENLNFVRRKLFLPERGRINNPADLVVFARDSLRPDQWAMAAAVAWLCAGIATALRRRLAKTRWIIPMAAALAAALVSAGFAVSQTFTTYNPNQAVIVAKSSDVYPLPSEKSQRKELRLKAGSEVVIEERRLEWSRVRADKTEGWIKNSDFARVWGDWDKLP